MRIRVGALLLAAAALPAQEPPPSPPPVDPAVVAAGEALLRAHGERSRGVAVLTADYRQTRTTRLAAAPLQSQGTFLFVREPACVLFRATAPRPSMVRVRRDLYEVYRPQQRRLERFRLDGPELAQGLFAALGGDADLLLREFSIVACGVDPADRERTRVVLAPRREAVRERLPELRLSLRTSSRALAAVAYRDHAGDLIEIELANVVGDPDPAPSCGFEVAEGTTVVEHAPPKRGG